MLTDTQGKSTFLQACLGEVDLLAGSAIVPREQTAFCSQDAWLRNESARSSIIFDSKHDDLWYRRVVQALALDRDFEVVFTHGLDFQTALTSQPRRRTFLKVISHLLPVFPVASVSDSCVLLSLEDSPTLLIG